MKIHWIIILGVFITSCHSKVKHAAHPEKKEHHKKHHKKHKTDHNQSNILMNETPFEELVQHFEEPNRDEWQKPDVVLSKFGNLEGKKIGDIGAGSGYFAFKMAEKGANVIAIDVDQRFVDYMNIKKEKTKVKNIHTRMAEYHDPHLTDNEFDGLITVNTYHHFNDRIDYLKRCYKGLKKGGQLMIVDFRKMETPFGPPVDHKIAHSQVVSELEKVGFTIDEVDIKSLPYQYVVLGKK